MLQLKRNIYFILAALPVTSFIISLIGSDYEKGYFPSWVYACAIISNVCLLIGAVVYFSLSS